MTREEAKKMLPIIKAFSEGKTIQAKDPGNPRHDWEDTHGNPNFDRNTKFLWRIKPATYRPFMDTDECFEEMKKHKPFGWLAKKDGNKYGCVIRIDKKEGSILIDNDDCWGIRGVFRHYTFADGTPFGAREED